MRLDLDNKIALVSGGLHGIGKSIVNELKKENAIPMYFSKSMGFNVFTNLKGAIEYFKKYDVDILINNVGGGGRWKESPNVYKDTIYLNLAPMIELTNQFLPKMLEKKYGRIITISSMYGKEAGLNPWFTSAKAYQIAYMKEMAKKYKDTGITFNTICPGEIDVNKVKRQKYFGDPEDVANLVTFLCSDKAKHINGATIQIDGGYSHSF